MHDDTAAPYGMVTRRWTGLTAGERDRQACRLVGVSAAEAQIEEPVGWRQYGRLVEAAAAGDPYAFAWLATSHRPLLRVRGRDLYAVDRDEWGSVCLELLHTTIRRAAASGVTSTRWARRQVRRRLSERLGQRARREVARARREQTVDPAGLDWVADPPAEVSLVDPGLREALAAALAQVDLPTREALVAMVEDRPLAAVAADHHLTPAAMRQRVHRARRRLQPQLAAWRRSA